MNTHELFNWLVVLTLLLPAVLVGNPMPVQAVLGSPHTLNTTETTDLAGPQAPTVSFPVRVNPPERTNNITTTIAFDRSDNLTDFEGSVWGPNAGELNSDGKDVSDDGISLQERYEADVETTQLNEARRLTAPASDLPSFNKTRRITAEPDTDDDGMPDAWESANGLNPNDPSDAWTDPDGDYVINLFEYQLSSDPNNASTPAVVTVSAGEDVEAAIESATTGQVIRVEGGTYNVNYRTFSPKTIMIQGGWNSDFTRRDLGATPTIFDGQSLDEVLYFSFDSGTNSVILDGLTLTNGEDFFGALNMIAQGTSTMRWSIMNCIIVNSESTSTFGGATHILHWDSSESDVFIINSIIANNSSSGIYNQTSETAVGRWKVINSDITNNQSTDTGEGYGIDGFTLGDAVLTIKLKNTILWGNQETDLEVTGFGYSTEVEAEYSDIGTVDVSSGAVAYNPGAGVVNTDPLFVAPDNGDFTLQEGSPCVDTGTNEGAPATDFEGDPRPLDGDLDGTAVSDIGADELRIALVDFSSATYSVDEGAGTATITVTLSAALGRQVTVDYATSDGTAVAPGDYTAGSDTLTFAPGDTSEAFIVPITDDTLDEDDETVTLTLSNANNAILGTTNNPAMLTIKDNDPLPTVDFSSATYSVDEGVGTATITLTLSAASGRQVTVDYATSDGAAVTPGDYTSASGTLTFAPGDTVETFDVTINDDALNEDDETVTLDLSNATNANIGPNGPATLTIEDNDPPPTVQFSSATYSVDENAGSATITVTLSEASGKTVTVTYATNAGTATAGTDYQDTTGDLVFAPGEINRTFNVTILDDTIDEPDETVNLTLSNPVNAGLGAPNAATLTILDDEVPVVDFDRASYSVDEGAGTVTITVTLDIQAWQDVTVDYAASDGTAVAPGDYTSANGTLTFAPGDMSETFDVTINEDTLDEDDETVVLALSDAGNATIGPNDPATLTIEDNDPSPTVQFSSATYSVGEGDGAATITVTLSAVSGRQVTVDYATSDGTAEESGDYTAASGTLTFAPGVITQTFTVPITDDALDEDDETVTLTLSDASNAIIGGVNPATLTILDNDDPPTVSFSNVTYSVDEGAGMTAITVTLDIASGLTVTVDYTTSDGTAIAGSDYLTAGGVLTFTPGIINRTFTISILDDTLNEPDETITLTLGNPTNATLGTLDSATLTILDDDDHIYLPLVLR